MSVVPTKNLSQSQFLLSLGLEPRLESLIKNASPDRAEIIKQAASRLTSALGMGSQYQVMGIVPLGQSEVYPFPDTH
jgi:NADH dehydrogenase [ubiquinone] 1 alpha subcomplex assembly factor 7